MSAHQINHKDLTWDPSSTIHKEQENEFVGIQGKVIQPDATTRGPLMAINSMVLSTCVEEAADIISEDNFGKIIQCHIIVSFMSISKDTTEHPLPPSPGWKKCKKVNSEFLAKHWGIDRNKALHNVQQTTQRGIRTTL